MLPLLCSSFVYLEGLCRCSMCICPGRCPPTDPCRCRAASTNNLHTNTGETYFTNWKAVSLKANLWKSKLPAHLNHEVILFLHFTDTSDNFLIVCVHGTRVCAKRWSSDVQIHVEVIIAPPAAVSGPVTYAVLVYRNQHKRIQFNPIENSVKKKWALNKIWFMWLSKQEQQAAQASAHHAFLWERQHLF